MWKKLFGDWWQKKFISGEKRWHIIRLAIHKLTS